MGLGPAPFVLFSQFCWREEFVVLQNVLVISFDLLFLSILGKSLKTFYFFYVREVLLGERRKRDILIVTDFYQQAFRRLFIDWVRGAEHLVLWNLHRSFLHLLGRCLALLFFWRFASVLLRRRVNFAGAKRDPILVQGFYPIYVILF